MVLTHFAEFVEALSLPTVTVILGRLSMGGTVSAIQRQLDLMAIRYVAISCRESIPSRDMALIESAFCSEMAVSELVEYFPFLRTRSRRKTRRPKRRR